MSTTYITRVAGYIESICESPSCALTHIMPSVASCMVSIQGHSFHADHVTEEALRTELEQSGELNFEYKDGTQINISRVTSQEPQTA